MCSRKFICNRNIGFSVTSAILCAASSLLWKWSSRLLSLLGEMSCSLPRRIIVLVSCLMPGYMAYGLPLPARGSRLMAQRMGPEGAVVYWFKSVTIVMGGFCPWPGWVLVVRFYFLTFSRIFWFICIGLQKIFKKGYRKWVSHVDFRFNKLSITLVV